MFDEKKRVTNLTRNFAGMKTLTEMLTEREAIAQLTETILDEGTEHWGVKVRESKAHKSNLHIKMCVIGGASRSQGHSSTTATDACYGRRGRSRS